MSCSKLMRCAHADLVQHEFDDGICFRFGSEKSDGMSLSGVDIIDDVPKLRFESSPKVPTLTEEDVAVVAQLVLENKRPSFFYRGFHSAHPFAKMGRLFKLYSPDWLRGTSVGELEAEADWAMKCLHVGVKSDPEKKQFWSRNKTSNLKGLKTKEDFNENLSGLSIVMECKSVDVDKQNEELSFVGNPDMEIHCVFNSLNSDYSKYITKHFNSVAYHDEPLFLKMQEIVKLVTAMEWIKEKLDERELTFSQIWINEHVEKRHECPTERIEVTVPSSNTLQIEEAEAKNERQFDLALADPLHASRNVSKADVEVKATANVLGLETEVTLRTTYNNYDFLFEGLDPNQPTDLEDKYTKEPFLSIPNVKSWNELYSQTVPQPCTALYTADGLIGPPVCGGISTNSFTTKEVKRKHPAQSREEVVSANTPMHELKNLESKQRAVPPSNIGAPAANSGLRTSLQNAGLKSGAGFCDNTAHSIWSDDGKQLLTREKKVEGYFQVSIGELDCPHEFTELRRDGTRGPKIKLHKQLLPPHASSRNLADECAKTR